MTRQQPFIMRQIRYIVRLNIFCAARFVRTCVRIMCGERVCVWSGAVHVCFSVKMPDIFMYET